MSLTPRQLIDELAGMELEWLMIGSCIRCSDGHCPIMAYYNAVRHPLSICQNAAARHMAVSALGMSNAGAWALEGAVDLAVYPDDYLSPDPDLRQYMIERLKPVAEVP